jgi:hypothetical protein
VGAVPVALAGLAVALVPTGGREVRPLPLVGVDASAKPALAFVWRKDEGTRIARIDLRRLRPTKVRSAALGNLWTWAFDPSKRTLIVAGHDDPYGVWGTTIKFVRVRDLRVLPQKIKIADWLVAAFLWTRADRIVALAVPTCCGSSGFAVLSIDAETRRVVEVSRFEGYGNYVGRTHDSLVVLQTPWHAIGTASLLIVRDDATYASVRLDRVTAGSTGFDESNDAISTVRNPAVAIDPAADHAYVIQPDGPAADVDLQKLTATYHDLRASASALARLSSWLTPSAEAKGWRGPSRYGVWLGDGLIALTGSDWSSVAAPDGVDLARQPFGAGVVDTRDWTLQMIDRDATAITVADGLLLTTGETWPAGARDPVAHGVAAYHSDRSLAFRVFPNRQAYVWLAVAGRAYVYVAGREKLAVVDLRTGRVIGARSALLPTPLVGDGS